MPQPFPVPPLHVFERLQITDGLLMTADLWRRAHQYHRQRQNFVYQALHQPGIVYGLGVAPIAPPAGVQSNYRDGRWLLVQPGVAIDGQGNPIVVPQAESFRIESEPPPGEVLQIFLTLSYVDPDQLRPVAGQTSQPERFRIIEKMQPGALDIELCRIRLSGEEITLTPATDVFNPELNALDLRDRPLIQLRPTGWVYLAQLTGDRPDDGRLTAHLNHLLHSLEGLYPRLQAGEPVGMVALPSPTGPSPVADELAAYDAVYAPWPLLQSLDAAARDAFAPYLAQGGVLVIGVDDNEAGLQPLYHYQQELGTALENLDEETEVELRQELEDEIHAFDQEIAQRIQAVVQSVGQVTQQLGQPLVGNGQISRQHPLRLFPFLFAQWPQIGAGPLTVLNWGGVVLILGDLATAWGLDEGLNQPRDRIRTAQELGINLLHFAWRRRQLSQLQQRPETLAATPATATLRDRVL